MEEKKIDPSRIEGFKRHRYVRSRGDEGDGCNMQCDLNPLRSSEIEIETSVLCVRTDYLSDLTTLRTWQQFPGLIERCGIWPRSCLRSLGGDAVSTLGQAHQCCRI
jgi:hypothetical protein